MSTFDTTDLPLLEHANDSAKKLALRWIKSVFRQISVQTLARLWNVEENGRRLHISHANLKASEEMCTRLGTFWCQRLRDEGHGQMAEWVHQVLDEKQFFTNDDETSTTLQNDETNDTTNNEATQEVEPLELTESTTNKLMTITKIRQLGQRKIGEQEAPSLERVSRTLDVLGRKGETDWPLEWSIIEDTVIQNRKRLHLETLHGKPRASTNNKTTYEVVPKSLVASQNNHVSEKDAILAAKEPLAKMIERKRKMAQEQQVTQASSTAPLLPRLARPPSNLGGEQHFNFQKDVVESLSLQEREKLQRTMIHTSNEEETEEMHSILGALQDVGDVHFQLQYGDVMDDFTENKRRREKQRAKRQRLFPREPIKQEKETKRAATKVVRSVVKEAEEQWMELDMNNCLVDVMDSETSQKRLCAFSSLEVMLKDEDAEHDEQ
jgi:hypothetical protein